MSKVIVSNLKAILPPKQGDAGYDLVATSDPKIVGAQVGNLGSPFYACIDYIEYEVDLRLEPSENLLSLIFPRSSISNYQLSLCNSVGVCDNGYRGLIKIRFNYLFAPNDLTCVSSGGVHCDSVMTEINFDKIYKKGDKIAQMVFTYPEYPSIEEGIPSETARGEKGFGSSGK
jgi:dUTPase